MTATLFILCNQISNSDFLEKDYIGFDKDNNKSNSNKQSNSK